MSDGNGALPEGWEKVAFGELVENHDRTRIPLKQSDRAERQGKYPYYGASGIIDQIDDYLFDGSYLLIAEDGANLLARSTPIAFQAHGQFWVNNHAHVVQPQRGVPREYLEHYFNSMSVRDYVTGSAQPKLTQKNLSAIPIRVAPEAEQRRIVSKIESLQERSSRARRALSKVGPLLEQFRQSVLRAAFSGRLTADWRAQCEAERKAREGEAPAEPHAGENGSAGASPSRYEPAHDLLARIRTERRHRWEQSELAKYEAKGKQPPKNWQDKYKEPQLVDGADLPELPDGWCWCPLEELATHQSGFAFKSKHFTDEGVQVVKLGNLYQGRFDLTRDPGYLPSDHEDVESAPVLDGDILVSQTGTRHKRDYGFFVLVPPGSEPLLLNQRVLSVRPVDPSLAEWLVYASKLGCYRDHFFSHETGGVNQGNVGVAGIMRGPVPLAPEEEIAEISRRLEEAYASAAEVGAVVAESESALTQLDQSILAKAFRGELVPQDPRDEPASELLAPIRTTREANIPRSSAKKKK
jgi:type I restriction enzyme S subunit